MCTVYFNGLLAKDEKGKEKQRRKEKRERGKELGGILKYMKKLTVVN
jgi:hypothetical protein